MYQANYSGEFVHPSMAAMQLAITNLKQRCNTLERENKILKQQMIEKKTIEILTANHNHEILRQDLSRRKKLGELKNQAGSNFIAQDKSDATSPNKVMTNENPAEQQRVNPTVDSIVANICDQLTIIGLQMESLLLDFNEIKNKDELLKISDTMEELIIPHLCRINSKKQELDNKSNIGDNRITKNNYINEEEDANDDAADDDGDVVGDAADDDDETKVPAMELRRLHRLLRRQNQMLKNVQTYMAVNCTIASDSKSTASIPFEGWTMLQRD